MMSEEDNDMQQDENQQNDQQNENQQDDFRQKYQSIRQQNLANQANGQDDNMGLHNHGIQNMLPQNGLSKNNTQQNQGNQDGGKRNDKSLNSTAQDGGKRNDKSLNSAAQQDGGNSKDQQKNRNDQNNAKNVQNLANAASKSANPYAKAAGTAVKVGDKITGGKVSETAGKAMTKVNQNVPGGKQIQNASNKFSESGASDKLGKAGFAKGGAKNGGGQNGSPPSNKKGQSPAGDSQGNNQAKANSNSDPMFDRMKNSRNRSSLSPFGKNSKLGAKNLLKHEKEESDEEQDSTSESMEKAKNVSFKVLKHMALILLPFLPIIFAFFIVLVILAGIGGFSSQFTVGMSVSETMGEDSTALEKFGYEISSEEEEEFTERIKQVAEEYEEEDKYIKPLAVAAVYYVVNSRNNQIRYVDFSIPAIRDIADAMLNEDGFYDEEIFRENLIKKIFPHYLPGNDSDYYEYMADNLFEYMERYYEFLYQGERDEDSAETSEWRQTSSQWGNVQVGNSGKTIAQIGCLATSVAIQIKRSGVSTNISNFNPGTFVEFLNKNGGFDSYGNLQYDPISKVADFHYVDSMDVSSLSRTDKLNRLKGLVDAGYYVVAEVKGNTGQHWVAVESVSGNEIKMIDPGSSATSMWKQYNWANTSRYTYFKANR